MLTKEQIEERKAYIGASDCAAVLGLSRWSTPLEVWAIKTGQVEQEDISDKLPIEVGNELEDLVCKLFEKRTGKKTHRVNETQYHPNHKFIAANLDRRIVGEDALLEAKTCSGWKAKEWEGTEVPREYLLQVQHQLAVTGKAYGYVAVLIGGNQDFVWKRVDRDTDLIRDIIKKETEFWVSFVEPKIMPTVMTKNDGDILCQLYPDSAEETEVQLGEEANIIVDLLEGLNADADLLEGQIEKARNDLKAMLKDAAVGLTDKYKITWKTQTRNGVDVKKLQETKPEVYKEVCKESKSRVLRISKIKTKGDKK